MKPFSPGDYIDFRCVEPVVAESGGRIRQQCLDGPCGGDTTAYPEAPQYNVEPSAEVVAASHDFEGPEVKATRFGMTSQGTGHVLAVAACHAQKTPQPL